MSVSPEDRQRLRELVPADGTYISFLEYRRLAINLAPALLADLEAAEAEVDRVVAIARMRGSELDAVKEDRRLLREALKAYGHPITWEEPCQS